jgi:hypothetical protein
MNRRGTFIVPVRRGMLVMPAEAEWVIKCRAADATSASLRRMRATFVVSAAARAEDYPE